MWSMFVVVNFPSQQQIDLWVRTASIFMFNEPLGGWRQATARDQRTKTMAESKRCFGLADFRLTRIVFRKLLGISGVLSRRSRVLSGSNNVSIRPVTRYWR